MYCKTPNTLKLLLILPVALSSPKTKHASYRIKGEKPKRQGPEAYARVAKA
jgi:hypothetical protein